MYLKNFDLKKTKEVVCSVHLFRSLEGILFITEICENNMQNLGERERNKNKKKGDYYNRITYEISLKTLSLTHTLYFALTSPLTLSHTHPPLSLSHTHTLSLSNTHTNTLPPTHTLSLTCMTASNPVTFPPGPGVVTVWKSKIRASSVATMSTITKWSMQNNSTSSL